MTTFIDALIPADIPPYTRVRVFFSDPYWPQVLWEATSAYAIISLLGCAYVNTGGNIDEMLQSLAGQEVRTFVNHMILLEVVKSWPQKRPYEVLPESLVAYVRAEFERHADLLDAPVVADPV